VPGSIFGIPTRPISGNGVVWSETLGGRMDNGSLGQAASGLSGLTLNRVPFGNSLGGLQDSGNLTFDGTTLTLSGGFNATTIGAATPGAGSFTTLALSSTITMASASGASQALISSLGSLIRHSAYGYSTGYTAALVGDAARGVGFGFDPGGITGGQFNGDNRDFFMRRGAATDWAWALGISGGNGTANSPAVTITDAGLVMQTGFYIQMGNTAVAATPVPTHTITVRDAAGTTYRIPCVV
jgi:hypothetical protein